VVRCHRLLFLLRLIIADFEDVAVWAHRHDQSPDSLYIGPLFARTLRTATSMWSDVAGTT
jgi:hypothetical protein